MIRTILIIGCGYVGLPLGRVLLRRGYRVYGTTRRRERIAHLEREGIEPVELDVLDPSLTLPKADAILFLVAGSRDETLPKGMAHLLQFLADDPPQRFVYTSSTGVYGDYGGEWVNEDSPRKASHPAGIRLIEAEDRLLNDIETRGFPGILARLSGIYGPGRLPGKDRIEKGMPISGHPDGILNLIHLEDLINALIAILSLGEIGETYLLSDDLPVRREDYYRFLAETMEIRNWTFSGDGPEGRSGNRRCRNDRMKERLGMNLIYPSYREGVASVIGRKK